jgi:hypothetical protein
MTVENAGVLSRYAIGKIAPTSAYRAVKDLTVLLNPQCALFHVRHKRLFLFGSVRF